jgi:signal transduction histidine kinase
MMSAGVRAPTLPDVTTRLRARVPVVPWLVDATIALGLSALSLLPVASGVAAAGPSDPLSISLLLLETLPLLVRRRWPVAVLIVTLAATASHAWLVQGQVVNESFGSLVALFTVAERYDRRAAVIAAIGVGVTFTAVIMGKGGSAAAIAGSVQTFLSVGVVLALGDWARTRRQYATAIEENARLQESGREERSRRAVEDERERIARELHDIVTHHVSVIVIQAGAGLIALDRRPEKARTALVAIDRTSRAALTDMRRMLGILGDVPGTPGTDDATRTPMPRLERLGELIEEVRAAGLPVELSLNGVGRPLDAGLELSAYRIVQEALTNALKHARGARARVRLSYEPMAIEIDITDQGGAGERDLGEAGTSGGRGLIGMRERVALYGGDFEAGPTPTGFRVHARLPLDPEAAVGT